MSWANRTGESRRILAEAKGHKFLHRLSMGQRFRQSPEKPKWGLKKLRKFTLTNIGPFAGRFLRSPAGSRKTYYA